MVLLARDNIDTDCFTMKHLQKGEEKNNNNKNLKFSELWDT